MTEPTPVRIPRENVNDESVQVLAWRVASGQRVEQGQALAELQGSKATFEIYAPTAGVVRFTIPEGDEVDVGGVLCMIEQDVPQALAAGDEVSLGPQEVVSNGAAPPSLPPAPAERVEATVPGLASGFRLSNRARRLAEQHGLDPAVFAGRGLVGAADVLQHLGLPLPAGNGRTAAAEGRPPAAAGPGPVAAHGVPFRTEKLSRSKRTEIKYLQSGHRLTLPSLVSVAVPTRGFRAAAEPDPSRQGHASALILFETARLLRKYRYLNAFYGDDAVHVYEEVNLGFAVDAGQGLKVPVLRCADRKSFPELAAEMRELVVRYLNNELPPAALAGGTFTVTDLSAEGVDVFLPRLNQGQAAILGVGGERFLPGGRWGTYQLLLAFDHQVSEGRLVAQFLNDLSNRLQSHEEALRQAQAPDRSGPGPCCARCLRPVDELKELGAHLLTTVNPDKSESFLCTNCLLGF
jgi:pyruvate/2-oxoglutarate dehydrogenase complex dihydrolipoamide acyltransferase (E2) component